MQTKANKNKFLIASVLLTFVGISCLVILAVVHHSPGRKLRRELMNAVNQADSKRFWEIHDKILVSNGESFDFSDESEKRAIHEVYGFVLRKWLNGEMVWNDGAKEKSTVTLIIGLSRSEEFGGGAGFLDTQEGFKLTEAVVAKLNEDSDDKRRKWFVTRYPDGTAAAGLRIEFK
jgi:hypothetical protein